MSKEIKLTRNKVAIVDDEDYEELNKVKWYCSPQGYAVRSIIIDNKKLRLQMHRIINKTPDTHDTDHINGNKLDNRKCNLRTVTVLENRQNSFKYSNNKSGYKGVWFHKYRKKWVAEIKINKEKCYIGIYKNINDVARAYNEYALKYFGEFAKLNVIDESKENG